MWKLLGDQVDEPHYETVGKGNKSKDEEGGDDRSATIWIHARKEYHRCNLLSEDAVEKWTEEQKLVHCAFIDSEKTYERVPKEELWECLRLAETSECYKKIIKDMYDGATTTERSAVGLTEEFKVDVELHQGLALRQFFLPSW